MTPSPQEPQPRTPRPWRRNLLRATIVLTGLTAIAGGAAAWWAWIFIQEKLAPLVETNLSQTLNRPVQLGKVEQVTLSGLRFGASALPPTPTDRDRVKVAAVQVDFNLLKVLWDRRLGLDVTLIRPDIFVDQTPDGRWINAKVTTREGSGPIKTELNKIQIEDGTIALSPSPRVSAAAGEPNAATTPFILTVRGLSGGATLQNQNQDITFNAKGSPTEGGNFELRGETLRQLDRTNLIVRAQDIRASDVSALLPLPLSLKAGQVGGNLAIVYQPGKPIAINGTAGFRDTTAQIAKVPNQFSRASGRLRFQEHRIFLEEVKGFYGQIAVEAGGSLDTQQGYDLTAKVRSTTIADLLKTFALKTPIALQGTLTADLKVTGALDQPLVTGTARNIRSVRADRLDFDRIFAQFNLTPRALTFDRLEATPSAGGFASGSGQLRFGQPGGIAFNIQASNVPGDSIARRYGVTNPNIRVGLVSANAQISGLVSRFQTRVQWRAPQATYPGVGEIVIADRAILFRNTEFQVAGGTVRGNGVAVNGGWQAAIEANQVAIDRFAPRVSGGRLNGQFRLAGTLANFNVNAIRGEGQVQIANVAGGSVRARGQLINGRWQAAVQASEVALNRFSSNLRGAFGGDFTLSGTLANLRPSAIRAQGQARFSQGIAQLNRPLTASVRWLGDRLQVLQATAPGFRADGVIFARLDGTPAISSLDLNVLLQNYDLASVPVALPNNIRVAGLADFSGRVRGTLAALNVAGQLQLANLVVNNLAFDPVMAGTVQYVGGQGTNLDLTGRRSGLLADLIEGDRIAVELNSRNRPTNFLIRRGDAIAQGTTRGDILTANLQNFPLETLNLTPAARLGIGAVGGLLTADISANLATLAAEGTIAIDQPRLGYINAARDLNQADRLTASFRYANGATVVNNGELLLGDSRYLLAGSISGGSNPQFRGNVTADRGKIEDILAALQYFDIRDFSRGLRAPSYNPAADLGLIPVGQPTATLLNQIRRFSEIIALQEQRAAQAQANVIPDLSTLRGEFTGDFNISGSARGITADFGLQGQNWRLGKYGVQQVTIAQGRFENGILTVLPARLDGLSYIRANGQTDLLEGSFLSYSGTVGGQAQSGQLQARRIPIGLVRDLFRSPLNLDGELNATATLSGTIANPQATGELSVANATLNNTAVQQATSFFSYNDARLNFTGRVVVSEPQPLTLVGSIPYRFPFMSVYPNSDAVSLDVNVQNEGLALLNLFQNQVAWVNGQGAVNLSVRGTVLEPLITGTAQLENATLTAQALPEPLTDVSGNIQFNRTQIEVQSFQGRFNQGQVVAQGVLPVFEDEMRREPVPNPLTVALNGLALNFKGLYSGGVDGQVTVAGSALAPLIGGTIVLSNGRVSLPDTSAGGATTVAASSSPTGESFTSPPEFQNLLITLGDRVLITREPILNFVATGDLRLDGALGALRPSGTISLRSGQVNLVTTQFNLDRRFDQTAIFRPNEGLDPFLDVQLIASVPEVTRTAIQSTTPYAASEVAIPSTEYGSLQTVRIRARVRGPASQIFQNLELSSSPSRTQNEILALIGGGAIGNLQQGDTTLAIANLAGSALLSNVQNFIGNALGLSEFRLFPTTITDARGTANFGLAAELGVDITRNISVSVLQILTSDEPTQFGLRYRISDRFLLRGSTNFSGETRAVLEYQQRF